MKYTKKVLANGLRIITAPLKDNPTITVLVMVEAGSKYEDKETNGLSHFLEHMCFKGTSKRPTALKITQELESVGSHYNAFTGEEYTGYYAKAAAKQGFKILDIISDLYLNPAFPKAEIEKEKGVIIEEINMYRDLPHQYVHELFDALLYGDQPAGWSILGPRERIQNYTQNDFLDYRSKHYVAEATTVVVAGHFNDNEMVAAIEEKFAGISNSKKNDKLPIIENQSKPEFKIEERATDQSHIVIGVRAYDINHDDTVTLRVLNAVLGSGMSSRLFQRLREEMGVGYYVHSSYSGFTDHGYLAVSIGCDVKRVEEVIKAILEELYTFVTTLVPEDELQKTKDYILGTMLLGLESSDDIADFYAGQEIVRRPIKTVEEIQDEIRAVTAEDIQRVAKDIMKDSQLNLAAIGPISDTEKIKDILHF